VDRKDECNWYRLKGGALWVIDADIRDYFGSINHDKLLLLVKQRITDRRVLKLNKRLAEGRSVGERSI
jgi:retron-type reverse transcriptase